MLQHLNKKLLEIFAYILEFGEANLSLNLISKSVHF